MLFLEMPFLLVALAILLPLTAGNIFRLGGSSLSSSGHPTTAAPVWKYKTKLQNEGTNVPARSSLGSIASHPAWSNSTIMPSNNSTPSPDCGGPDYFWCMRTPGGTCWDYLDDYHRGGFYMDPNCTHSTYSTWIPPTTERQTYTEVLSQTIHLSTIWTTTYLQRSTRYFYPPGGTTPAFSIVYTSTGTPETWYDDTMIPTATITHTKTITDGGYYALGDDTNCPGPQIIGSPLCSPDPDGPRCIAEWNSWLSLNTRYGGPWCSFGSLRKDQCDHIYTSWFETASSTYGTKIEPTPWAVGSDIFFAPGCTAPCGECSLTGDRVKLLYWPPKTAMPEPHAATPTQVVAYVDGTTLTSPTLYVSYRTLFAADLCSVIGPNTYRNTIIPIGDNQLSSLIYHPLRSISFGQGSSFSTFDHDHTEEFPDLQWTYNTASFDLNDLVEPIPRSLYDELPVCAALTRAAHYFGEEPLPCFTNAPYEPLIAMPKEMISLEPEWSTCSPWYAGLYDPPSALQGATVIAPVTRPSNVYPTPTPASPSSPLAWLPTETAAPQMSDSNPEWSNLQPAQATGVYTIDGKTFTAIGPMATVIDGTTYSLAADDSELYVNGRKTGLNANGQSSWPTAKGDSAALELLNGMMTQTRSHEAANGEKSSSIYGLAAQTSSGANLQAAQSVENSLPKSALDSIALELLSDIMGQGHSVGRSDVPTIIFMDGPTRTASSMSADDPQAISVQQIATTVNSESQPSGPGQTTPHSPKNGNGAASTNGLQGAFWGLISLLAMIAVL